MLLSESALCCCQDTHTVDFILYATTINLCAGFLLEASRTVAQVFLRFFFKIRARFSFQKIYFFSLYHRTSPNCLIIKKISDSKNAIKITSTLYRQIQLALMIDCLKLIEKSIPFTPIDVHKSDTSNIEINHPHNTLHVTDRFIVYSYTFLWTTIVLLLYALDRLETTSKFIELSYPFWTKLLLLKILPSFILIFITIRHCRFLFFESFSIPIANSELILAKLASKREDWTISNEDASAYRIKKSYLSIYKYLAIKRLRKLFRSSIALMASHGNILAIF